MSGCRVFRICCMHPSVYPHRNAGSLRGDELWAIITIIFAARHLGATVSIGILDVILLWRLAVTFTVRGAEVVG